MNTCKAVGRFLYASVARFIFAYLLLLTLQVHQIEWWSAAATGVMLETIASAGFPNFRTPKEAR